MPKFDPNTMTLSNSVPMADDTSVGVTSHAALTVDNAILAIASSKTAVHFWNAGSWLNGNPLTGDMVVMTDSMTISASGNAVFNLTSDHTSSGTAICSNILVNSCVANFVDGTGVYSQGLPSVAGDFKTVTIATTKKTDSLVTILTISVVGSQAQSASPNGTVVKFFGIGVAA